MEENFEIAQRRALAAHVLALLSQIQTENSEAKRMRLLQEAKAMTEAHIRAIDQTSGLTYK